MVQEITIEVGDSFAGKHEQFEELLGGAYNGRLRSLVEDELHTITQEIERQSEEKQAQIEQNSVEELTGE